MYRIIFKKAHDYEIVAYKKDMQISDLFKDREILSVNIVTEKSKTYSNELEQTINNFPTKNIDGNIYKVVNFIDIENMKDNPNVHRVEFIKKYDEYVIFKMLYSDEYVWDTNAYFIVKI